MRACSLVCVTAFLRVAVSFKNSSQAMNRSCTIGRPIIEAATAASLDVTNSLASGPRVALLQLE